MRWLLIGLRVHTPAGRKKHTATRPAAVPPAPLRAEPTRDVRGSARAGSNGCMTVLHALFAYLLCCGVLLKTKTAAATGAPPPVTEEAAPGEEPQHRAPHLTTDLRSEAPPESTTMCAATATVWRAAAAIVAAPPRRGGGGGRLLLRVRRWWLLSCPRSHPLLQRLAVSPSIPSPNKTSSHIAPTTTECLNPCLPEPPSILVADRARCGHAFSGCIVLPGRRVLVVAGRPAAWWLLRPPGQTYDWANAGRKMETPNPRSSAGQQQSHSSLGFSLRVPLHSSSLELAWENESTPKLET